MTDEVKRCPRCKETKPIATDWYVIKTGPKAGRATGYCRKCDSEKRVVYRGGDLEEHRRRVERKEKCCPRCRVIKPIETGFYVLKTGSRAGRISGYCRQCDTERSALDFGRTPGAYNAKRERDAAWAAENPGKTKRYIRAAWLVRRYGITIEQYEAMLEAQGGRCAACGEVETRVLQGLVSRLCVDHCHTTGQVRGLLCHNCNLAVGHMRDDPTVAYALGAYLERTMQAGEEEAS